MAEKRKEPSKAKDFDKENINIKKHVKSTQLGVTKRPNTHFSTAGGDPCGNATTFEEHKLKKPENRSTKTIESHDLNSRCRSKSNKKENSLRKRSPSLQSPLLKSHNMPLQKVREKSKCRKVKGSLSQGLIFQTLYSDIEVTYPKPSILKSVQKKLKISSKSHSKKPIPVAPVVIAAETEQKEEEKIKQPPESQAAGSQPEGTQTFKKLIYSYMPDTKLIDTFMNTVSSCIQEVYDSDEDIFPIYNPLLPVPQKSEEILEKKESTKEEKEICEKKKEIEMKEKTVFLRCNSEGDGLSKKQQKNGVVSAKTITKSSSSYPDFRETSWEFNSKYKLTTNSKQGKKTKKRKCKNE